MKQKKTVLWLGLAGLGAYLTYRQLQKEATREAEVARMTQELRQFFSQLGVIEVLYFNDYQSADEATSGGVVLANGQTYTFSYYQGDFTYQEVTHADT